MGMSTHVVGIISGDTEQHKGMMDLWRTCIKMKVTVPDEVIKYFGDEEPDDAGKVVDIERIKKGPQRDSRSISPNCLPA